jgi:stage V sporulation protein B
VIFLSEIKKFVSDVGITFISSALGMLLSFPISMLLGRYLGASDLGLYRLAMAIFGIFELIISFGIPAAVINYVAQSYNNEEELGQIVSVSLITSIALGITSFLLVYLNANSFADLFHMPEISGLMKILAFAYPFSIVNDMLFGLLNGQREMKKSAWASFVQSTSILIFTFLLVFKYGVVGAVAGTVFSSLLTTLLLISIKKIPKVTTKNYFKNLFPIINFGSKALLSNIINIVNFQADILMIGYFMTKTDVGIYSVAIIFSRLIWIFPDSVQKITFPLISEYYSKEQDELIKILIDRCMKYSAMFLMLFYSLFLFFGQLLVNIIFGSGYESSVTPLNILIIGTLFFGITKSVGSIFASIGKINLVYKIPLISAVSNLILNAILIPIFGINGAAFSTTISFIISTILMLYFMKSLMNIHIDYEWYLRFFAFNGTLISLGFCLRNLANPILLGCTLILIQCVLYSFFVPSKDKDKIFSSIRVYFN